MKLNLGIEYPRRLTESENGTGPTPELVSFSVVSNAVASVYGSKQMGVHESRLWSRIQDKMLDEDGKPMAGDIELSREQFEFVSKTVTEAKYPPSFAVAVTRFAEYLDEARAKNKGED